MPDEKAWGKKKSQFYGADVSDIDSEDIGSLLKLFTRIALLITFYLSIIKHYVYY